MINASLLNIPPQTEHPTVQFIAVWVLNVGGIFTLLPNSSNIILPPINILLIIHPDNRIPAEAVTHTPHKTIIKQKRYQSHTICFCLLSDKAKNAMHIIICTVVEAGVARPIWKSDTGTCLLIIHDIGSLTQNAPIMP